MKRRGDTERGPALYRLGPLTVLGCAFALGGVLGGALAGLIAGEAAQNLKDFLVDYLTAAQNGEIAAEFWPMAWEQGRFFLGACLLGVTALGTAGIPALFCVRGFLFSFSVAAFCRIFGPAGLAPALCLFGLPAFLWAPALFLAGTQCLEGSYALLRRALGDSRVPLPHSSDYWGRLALYGLGLALCVALECAAAPLLLEAAARFVL